MDSKNLKSVIETYEEFHNLLGNATKETYAVYQNIARSYDDIMDHRYRSPEILSKLCVKYLANNSVETVLLDVASGTGRTGHALRASGYKGIIDGIEASSKMIEECMKKKKIYRKVKEHYLTKNHPMPFSDNTYDVVVCAGALLLGHVPHQCLQDMIRVLRPGGILLFNVSRLDCDIANIAILAVQTFMKQMVLENRCNLIEEILEPSYEGAEIAYYYCYRK